MSAMERTTYRRSNALAFDEPLGNPQPAPYTSGPSTDPSSDDSIPLFLSDLQGQPDPEDLTPFVASQRPSILTRVVAGGLAVLAFAILVAVLNSDVTRALVSNSDVTRFLIDKARAPMGGASRDQTADQSATQAASKEPAVRQVLLEDPAPASDPVLQSQVLAARAGNEAAAPSKTLDAETLAALMTRAKSMLTLGDIAAARLLLERAANAQDATAAFLLAQTYDPAVLGVRDPRSITPDPVRARDWYRKAASFGSAAAQQRLTQFQN
jgi:TPR repeat protein